jgi:hypothetical protein
MVENTIIEKVLSTYELVQLGGFEPGTDVMILKIFSQKKIAKKLAFLTQNNKTKQIFDHNIGF